VLSSIRMKSMTDGMPRGAANSRLEQLARRPTLACQHAADIRVVLKFGEDIFVELVGGIVGKDKIHRTVIISLVGRILFATIIIEQDVCRGGIGLQGLIGMQIRGKTSKAEQQQNNMTELFYDLSHCQVAPNSN